MQAGKRTTPPIWHPNTASTPNSAAGADFVHPNKDNGGEWNTFHHRNSGNITVTLVQRDPNNANQESEITFTDVAAKEELFGRFVAVKQNASLTRIYLGSVS